MSPPRRSLSPQIILRPSSVTLWASLGLSQGNPRTAAVAGLSEDPSLKNRSISCGGGGGHGRWPTTCNLLLPATLSFPTALRQPRRRPRPRRGRRRIMMRETMKRAPLATGWPAGPDKEVQMMATTMTLMLDFAFHMRRKRGQANSDRPFSPLGHRLRFTENGEDGGADGRLGPRMRSSGDGG